MARDHEAQPAQQSGNQQAGYQQAGQEPAAQEPAAQEPAGSEPPQESNVNQVRDEPFPASHHDDGRPGRDDESAAPGGRDDQG